MIIELIGQPASGKTYLIKQFISCYPQIELFPVDIWYNKKNKLKKIIFLFSHIKYLDINYYKIKKMIKLMWSDNRKYKNFCLKEFRVHYILSKYGFKNKNKSIIFSEGLVNFSRNIFFKDKAIGEKNNIELFKQYASLLEKTCLKRDCLVLINSNSKINILKKAERANVSLLEYEKKGILEEKNWNSSIKYILKDSRTFNFNLVEFKNNYTLHSEQQFNEKMLKILKYEK